jgi:metal-dependent hydrolase (beta-lactamase superfamily II)
MIQNNFVEQMEREELVKKLIQSGYGPLIEILLNNENKVYTKKGRLNQSGACRVLGCKPKELREILEKCKEVIGSDYEIFT